MRNRNLKKIIVGIALTMVFSITNLAIVTKNAYAHGYIDNSRTALAKKGINTDVGGAQYEPQSIEGKGGFPESGPKDGEIASAGHFPKLDEQSETRWAKVPMNGGKNTFTWTLTAAHRTSEWKYYITKKGWNPNSPLNRGSIEEIGRVSGYNERPLSTVTHTINVPTDREGYYVILGVWEIADTGNAFYQVIDIDLKNDGMNNGENNDNIAPTAPTELVSLSQTSKSIDLTWNKSIDNIGVNHYNIYRDNEKVKTVTELSVTDTNLKANTTYTYKVKAVDNSGNESEASNEIKIKTKEIPAIDNEAPSTPIGVHSMGETKTTIDLHWNPSTDNVGVEYYEVYRNGVKVKTTKETRFMDSGLKANTEYKYIIKAIDAALNVSIESEEFKVKTKEEIIDGLLEWNDTKVYLKGNRVIYNGVEYTAKWWTSGELPGKADVWESYSDDNTMEWNSSKVYNGGNKVVYNGDTYEAKWWTKSEEPGISDVWRKL